MADVCSLGARNTGFLQKVALGKYASSARALKLIGFVVNDNGGVIGVLGESIPSEYTLGKVQGARALVFRSLVPSLRLLLFTPSRFVLSQFIFLLSLVDSRYIFFLSDLVFFRCMVAA
jgi:hypothetical protein